MAQQFRAPAALPEDLGLTLGPITQWLLTTGCYSSPKGSETFFWLPQAPAILLCADLPIGKTPIHIKMINKNQVKFERKKLGVLEENVNWNKLNINL